MAYRLKDTNLQNFFNLCTDYKRPSGTVMRFYAESDSNGRRVHDIIKSVYGNEYKYHNYGVLGIGNYKDFNVKFKSSADCKRVYEDIEGAMNAYGESGAATALDADDGGENGLSSNTITYIIIGAVMLLVVVLLLTRKRK